MKTVLFERRFKKFQGGHLKAYHYFTHVLSSPNWTAQVRFSEDSVWDESNPWTAHPDNVLALGEDCPHDVHFLGGRDWERIPQSQRENPPVPRINLIQHTRHGFPDDPRRPFLRYRAVRICCSEEVAESIRAAGANGPVFTNPYGLDPGELPEPIPFDAKPLDLLIVAIKGPRLGRRLRWRLWRPGRRVGLLTQPILRSDFLGLVNRARVTLFLPHVDEGFYIPALEGMGLDTIVVCPDCVGNRSFCIPERTCLRPPFEPRAIRNAAEDALRLSAAQAEPLLKAAREMFGSHTLVRERERFLSILDDLDGIW
jgi:hypothetical protein